MPARSHFVRRQLLLVALILPAALVATLELLYSQNTLYLNDQWVVQKRMVQMGLMGADEYLLTRTPLAQNRLNLGSYYGYQEVLRRDLTRPQAVKFRFRMNENSYFDFTFNRENHHFAGVRVSRSHNFPAQEFESDDDGQITTRRPLDLPNLSDGWHRLKIESQNDRLQLQIDDGGKAILSRDFSPGQLGLRSGLTGAEFNDFAIRQEDGRWLSSSFSNARRWVLAMLLNTFIFYLLAWMLSRLLTPMSLSTDRKALFSWILIGGMCFFCGLTYFTFDFFFYSPLIHADNGITHNLNSHGEMDSALLERARRRFFEIWYQAVGGDTLSHAGIEKRGYPVDQIWAGPIFCTESCDVVDAKQIPSPKSPNTLRILFAGTSQTLGAGARALHETFFVRTHSYLRAGLGPKVNVESLNASVSGATSESLRAEIHKKFGDFSPDLMVINLSNNDNAFDSENHFESTMREWIEEIQKYGTQLVLLEEANSTEAPLTLAPYYQILRKLGKSHSVPVWPMHDYLAQPYLLQSGTLWWDFVHLTSFGQEKVADWLAPQLLAMLQKTSPHP